MRKKAIIALMLAVGISQTGMTATYINLVKVYAETKTGDKYINGSTKITQDDLVMSSFALGYTVKDGCKYVVERDGKYYASEYYSEKNEEAEGGVAQWCEFKKSYGSKEDALKAAQEIPKDVAVYLDLNTLKVSKTKDLSGVRLIIYDGSSEVASATLDKLDSLVGEPKDDSSSTDDTDNTDGNEEPEVDGKVKVTVKNRKIGNDLDVSNKLTVTWDLKNDKASTFEIYGSDCYEYLSGKKSGSKTMSVDLANGTYNYELDTESGGVVTGSFKVANTFTDDDSDSSSEDLINSNEKAPKLKITGIPKKLAIGQSFDLKIKSDKDAIITFNGRSSGKYEKNAKFSIMQNGFYTYSAVGKTGRETRGSIEVKCFKKPSEIYSGDSYWTGNTIGAKAVSTIKRLVQTGMYDIRMLVVAGILGVSGVVTLGYRFYNKKRRKDGSNAKNS